MAFDKLRNVMFQLKVGRKLDRFDKMPVMDRLRFSQAFRNSFDEKNNTAPAGPDYFKNEVKAFLNSGGVEGNGVAFNEFKRGVVERFLDRVGKKPELPYKVNLESDVFEIGEDIIAGNSFSVGQVDEKHYEDVFNYMLLSEDIKSLCIYEDTGDVINDWRDYFVKDDIFGTSIKVSRVNQPHDQNKRDTFFFESGGYEDALELFKATGGAKRQSQKKESRHDNELSM